MNLHLPLDHAILAVRDLEAAGAAFAAAGFLVTPETRHSAAMGTANRCVMLHGSYIELLAIVEETPANAPWRALLAAGPRLAGLALASDDIAASAASLSAAGVRAQATRHFERATDHGNLRFSIIRIEPEETPGLQCLFCQHHTRDRVWLPDLLDHPNGATTLDAIALPQADSLRHLAGSGKVAILSGPARLTITGRQAAVHDLTQLCGVTVEVRTP